jgi:hypothetical protein
MVTFDMQKIVFFSNDLFSLIKKPATCTQNLYLLFKHKGTTLTRHGINLCRYCNFSITKKE